MTHWFCIVFILPLVWSVAAQASTPLLVVDDPAVLSLLEKDSLSFSSVIEGQQFKSLDNQSLMAHPHYRRMVRHLTRALNRRKTRDPKLSVTMATSRRLFDARWLRSPDARFELVGVVNRMDRQAFHSKTCGELRLIYRLTYRGKWRGSTIHSRLPMTVNVVFWLRPASKGESCASLASRWIRPEKTDPKAIHSALTSPGGPLSVDTIRLKRQKSVEVNLQSVRWPSTVRPDMGGYAEYVLRVFKRKGKKLVPARMENTPDIGKINRSRRLKRALLNWLTKPGNLQRIDDGTVNLPAKFLTRKATSFALHGLSRKANRPFDQIFSPNDFKGVAFDGFQTVKSAESLLHRLNDMSCVGCHQNRTVAGFHFLGIDREETQKVNAILTPGSPHFVRDQMRRRRFVSAVAAGRRPVNSRPFSERADHHEGDYGSHCGLPDSIDYGHWTCQPGLTCQVVDAPPHGAIGECLPAESRAGAPCQVGTMTQQGDPLKDRIVRSVTRPCASGYYCEIPRVGFPGGMCSDGCADIRKGEVCGSIALLGGFNRCLARGKKPFFTCLSENVRPGSLRACDSQSLCRDDYICAQIDGKIGGCIPPYFLFQLRVDGHPRPRLK